MDAILKKFHMEVDCSAYPNTANDCEDNCVCCLNEVAAKLESYGAKHVEARIDGGSIQCTFYLPLDSALNLKYIKGVHCYFTIDE